MERLNELINELRSSILSIEKTSENKLDVENSKIIIEEIMKGLNSQESKFLQENTFLIDFEEFAFLVEACIPPKPIARTQFWKKVINNYYHQMNWDERNKLHEWINLNGNYKEQLKGGGEYVEIFEARFNPDNQYYVKTKYGSKKEYFHCFLYNDRYYTRLDKFINDDYIITVEKMDIHK